MVRLLSIDSLVSGSNSFTYERTSPQLNFNFKLGEPLAFCDSNLRNHKWSHLEGGP